MEPTHDFFGLTEGIIFFVPKLVPKIKAAESQAQTDTTRANVKFVLIRRSYCLISIDVPSKTGTNRIPAKVEEILSVEFSLAVNNSKREVTITIKIMIPIN